MRPCHKRLFASRSKSNFGLWAMGYEGSGKDGPFVASDWSVQQRSEQEEECRDKVGGSGKAVEVVLLGRRPSALWDSARSEDTAGTAGPAGPCPGRPRRSAKVPQRVTVLRQCSASCAILEAWLGLAGPNRGLEPGEGKAGKAPETPARAGLGEAWRRVCPGLPLKTRRQGVVG